MSGYLDNVPEENIFNLDGRGIRNLRELLATLNEITDEQFGRYVGEDYNYFIPWIAEVVRDDELAVQLVDVKERQKFAEVLNLRIQALGTAADTKTSSQVPPGADDTQTSSTEPQSSPQAASNDAQTSSPEVQTSAPSPQQDAAQNDPGTEPKNQDEQLKANLVFNFGTEFWVGMGIGTVVLIITIIVSKLM